MSLDSFQQAHACYWRDVYQARKYRVRTCAERNSTMRRFHWFSQASDAVGYWAQGTPQLRWCKLTTFAGQNTCHNYGQYSLFYRSIRSLTFPLGKAWKIISVFPFLPALTNQWASKQNVIWPSTILRTILIMGQVCRQINLPCFNHDVNINGVLRRSILQNILHVTWTCLLDQLRDKQYEMAGLGISFQWQWFQRPK